jgi:hypothetical protein
MFVRSALVAALLLAGANGAPGSRLTPPRTLKAPEHIGEGRIVQGVDRVSA